MRRLIVVAVVLLAARPAEAWDPLGTVAKAAKKVGRTIGDVLGVGGFVESATTPTIRNAEESGRRLINDVDAAVGRQLDHAGVVAGTVVGDVDRSLQARIVQVDATIQRALGTTFDRAGATIGQLDEVARKRIDQLANRVGALLDKADAKLRGLLDQANRDATALIDKLDGVVAARVGQVQQLVATSLVEADRIAEARIDQLDEVAGRRIGTIDAIATKQSLALEGMLLRVGALIALVGFLGFVLWRLFREASEIWKRAAATRMQRFAAAASHFVPRFAGQLALGIAGCAVLYVLSMALPRDTQKRADEQIKQHSKALGVAFSAYDFTGVRYHSTQLELLETDEAPRYRAYARKAELLRLVLGRPALLQTVAGVRQIAAELTAVEAALVLPDPDVIALKAFVLWQIGATRRDEYEAALLCQLALATRPTMPERFLLEPLARNYLHAFLHDPYPVGDGVTAEQLAALRALDASAVEAPQFQQVVEYNRLVAQLDRSSTAAYFAMLDAHVDYLAARAEAKAPEPAAAKAARERRTAEAAKLVDAWRTFDGELASSPWLVDDPTALAAFTLDDAVLSHALYFVAVPDARELPPALLALPPPQRIAAAPLRLEWARRYATLVGARASDVLAAEETRRFAAFETRALAFESGYVKLQLALRAPRSQELAAIAIPALAAAAEMPLVRDTPGGRRAIADVLADAYGAALPPELAVQLANAAQHRRLRFL